jgi:Spy/CpxP family protein refolding chaperone
MNGLNKRTLSVYLLAIFVAGAAAGLALGYSSGRKTEAQPPAPREMADHIQSRLEQRLGLTPEQIAKIRPLIEQSCAEMGSVHEECWQRVSEALRRMNHRIAEHLTPEQRHRLEEMDQARREKVRMKCGPRSNMGPAGAASERPR